MKNRNGVDVDKLNDLIGIIKVNPEVGSFKFRADAEWINGAHSRTKIMTSSGKLFVFEGDEPPILIGSDTAPNAVQAVLHALASCMVVSIVYNAAVRRINVEALELDLEGDLDLRGLLGISEDVRPGYQNIRISCRIKSDAPGDKIEELLEYAQRISPVVDIIRNGVPVSIALEKRREAIEMHAGQTGAVEESG